MYKTYTAHRQLPGAAFSMPIFVQRAQHQPLFLAYGHLPFMIDGGNRLSWMVLAGLYFIIFLKEGEPE